MSKKFIREKAAEAASLCRRGIGILGKSLRLNWLDEDDDALGYTACGNPATVNVAWYHDFYFKPLSDDKQRMFRAGVFAHELLHQVYTNFDYTNAVTRSLKKQGEAAIFMEFANTLEDPAIEFFAPNAFGGWLLDCLRFMIRHIYKMSPGIGKEPTPYRQLINALVEFGDMGMVKGKFTFPEAKEYFCRVAPIYNEGICCPDSKKRIDYAKECFEICRPLWEQDLENEEIMRKLIEELLKNLEMSGEGEKSGEGMPMPSSSSAKRRSKMLSKMKGMPSGSPSDSSEEDGEEGEDSSEDGEGKGKGSSTEGEEDSEPSKGSGSSGEKDDSEASDDSDEKSDEKTDGDSGEDITSSEDEANSIADEESEEFTSDETIKEIEKSIEKAEEEARKADVKRNAESKDAPLPDFKFAGKWRRADKATNVRPKAGSYCSSAYATYVSRYSWDIKRLTKSLSKIFAADKEEERRATSGGYNIMRGSIGCTAKIFDKRREPGNKKDVAVVIAIDISGSMSWEGRIDNARKMAIVLAESLESLHIPYYIMGFTADENHVGAHHIHFVDWNDRKKDKETLATMQARSNNFDGYSIRYAANLLKSRPEKNKILFVTSDGEPACNSYSTDAQGIEDTTMAIKEARKIADTVFGIALGSSCPVDTLHKMYGKDFVAVNDPSLLTSVFCKKLEKVINAK